MKTVKSKETLECALSKDELLELGQKLSRATQNRMEAESSKKSYVAQLGANIKSFEAEIERLSSLVNTGKEVRGVSCETRYHVPTEGWKQTIRLDTGETIREGKMSQEELENLFLNALGDQGDMFVFSKPHRREVDLIDLDKGGAMADGWSKYGAPYAKPEQLLKVEPGPDREFAVTKDANGYQLWSKDLEQPAPEAPATDTEQPKAKKGKSKGKAKAKAGEPEKPATGDQGDGFFVLASGHRIAIVDLDVEAPVNPQEWASCTDMFMEGGLAIKELTEFDDAGTFQVVKNGKLYGLWAHTGKEAPQEPQAEQPAVGTNPFDKLTGDAAADTDNNETEK